MNNHRRPLFERFTEKYITGLTPDSCWIWIGATNGKYGMTNIGKQRILAHRASLLLKYGEPPTDDVVMHQCDNTLCVNPMHLRGGTQKENMQDALTKARPVGRPKIPLELRNPHCKNGHPYDAANTAVKRDGSWVCRICRRAVQRDAVLRRKKRGK